MLQRKRVPLVPDMRFDHMHQTREIIPKQRGCGHCGKNVSCQCRKCVVALHVDCCLAAFHSKWTEMPPSRYVLGRYNGLWVLLGTDITSNNTDTNILSHWITHYYSCLCVAVSIDMTRGVTTQRFLSGVFWVICAQRPFKRTPGYLSNQ